MIEHIENIDELGEDIFFSLMQFRNFFEGLILGGDRGIYGKYLRQLEEIIEMSQDINWNIEKMKEKMKTKGNKEIN